MTFIVFLFPLGADLPGCDAGESNIQISRTNKPIKIDFELAGQSKNSSGCGFPDSIGGCTSIRSGILR